MQALSNPESRGADSQAAPRVTGEAASAYTEAIASAITRTYPQSIASAGYDELACTLPDGVTTTR
jgi:hypothetical protein